MRKRVSIKTINKNKTSKTLLNVFMLTFIMFIIGISTVYALSYTVSYNNNGGSGSMSNSTFTSNPGTLRTNTFTKSGYKFMGWNKNSGGTSTWYRETNSITGTDGSSTTLYAQWCKNSTGTIKISNAEQKDSYGNYVFRNNKYITVTADNKTINYGETPSYSYTVAGTLNGETGVTGTASYTVKNSGGTTVNPSSAEPGTYTISVSGLTGASGYAIQNTYTGTLTINILTTPVPLAANFCNSLTYNGSNQTLVSTADTGFSWDSSTITGKNATSYTVKANLKSGYKWSDNTTGQKTITCSIGKKSITITADNKTINYGGTPSYSYTVAGAISGETAVTGAATYIIKDSEEEIISNVQTAFPDTYTIIPSGLTIGSNYTASYANGTLTINGITVTLDINMEGATYGNSTNEDGWRFKQKTESFPEGYTSYQKNRSYCCGTTAFDENTGKITITGTRYAANNLANKTCAKTSTEISMAGDSCTYTVSTAWDIHNIYGEDSETVSYNEDKILQSNPKKAYDNSNTTYQTLLTPTHSNYTFLGWYTAKTGGTQVTDTSTLVASTNHTLYAHWGKKNSTLNLYANGGLLNDDSWKSWTKGATRQVTLGLLNTTMMCCSTEPSIFDAAKGTWAYTTPGVSAKATNLPVGKYCIYATSADREGLSCTGNSSNEIYISSTTTGSNTNNTYYVTNKVDREEVDSCIDQSGCHRTIFGQYGEMPEPTREGKQFVGWFTAPAGGIEINEADELTTLALYAHWAGDSIITADANGGTIPATTGWSGTGTTATKTISVGGTYGTMPAPTKTGYSFAGWYTAQTGGKYIDENDKATGDKTIYAHWIGANEKIVNIRVKNGKAESNNKIVTSNTSVSFTITPNEGTNYTSTTCTNGQNGVMTFGSGTDTLTISNLSQNTLCNVVYTPITYTITYHTGTETTATEIPAPKTKTYGIDIYLSGTAPQSSSKTFIGWATIENATDTTGTWYEPGDIYSENANLDLYAQWYDVASLEQKYTTFTQSGSGTYGSGNDFKIQSGSISMSINGGSALSKSYTASTISGYKAKYISSWSEGSLQRPYRMINGGVSVRNLDTSTTSNAITYYYLHIRDRQATTYPNDKIDTRIDRLQKIQDVAIKYSEIKAKSVAVDNKSVTNGGAVTAKLTPDSGYYLIGPGGFNMANASTDGGNVSRAYVWSYMYTAISGGGATGFDLSPSRAYTSVTPKIKITLYGIEVLAKTARSTTFSAGTGKGAARYAALTALDADKGNYFPTSYLKVSSKISGATASPSAWGSATASKTLTISDGKILGLAGFGVANGTDGSGESYASISKAYLGGLNTQSGTFHMTWYGGNKNYTVTTGNAQTKVYGYGYALYISSGSMTIS